MSDMAEQIEENTGDKVVKESSPCSGMSAPTYTLQLVGGQTTLPDEVITNIDILEQEIFEISPDLLKTLLKDYNTNQNIRWACDEYAKYGEDYTAEKQILPHQIIGDNTFIIQPRTAKAKEEQRNRTRKSAEVFTPSWICNEMNNHCDEQWFGRPDVFNVENDHNWVSTQERIIFPSKKKSRQTQWHEYVKSRRIEITCGEAPYLVSRYDTTTGEPITVEQRIGILDRKLRVVNENTEKEKEWLTWTKRAYQNTYGYEYQGDNLLLARENLLYTFVDNFRFKFHKIPNVKHLKNIAEIISQNIWQMDGLTYCSPYSTADERQLELFSDIPQLLQTTFCQVKDWQNNAVYLFRDLKGDKAMKFDFAIGNPPYQENIENRGEQPPLYHKFYDEATKISDFVSLITPGRFLFDAGKTPHIWNQKMLNNKHFKVISYYPNSKDVFNGVDIKGGVAITCINQQIDYGEIVVFIQNDILREITRKVKTLQEESINTILYSNTSYKYSDAFFSENKGFSDRVSGGSSRYLSSSVFDKFPEAFYSEKPNDTEYAQIIGRQNNERVIRYFKCSYLTPPDNFNNFKVFIPSSNGSGALGEVFSTPVMGYPVMGSTETFISFGNFKNIDEAQHLLKYVKTKFLRVMLGTRKITQGNKNPNVWSNVPLQDFTDKSDIDWSKSIHEIDLQLYQKYGLNDEEIKFIETHVKEMA